MTTYRYVVPDVYHCDNHTPGDVFTVRLTGDVAQHPDWFTVENIDTGDQFPVQLSELRHVGKHRRSGPGVAQQGNHNRRREGGRL